MKTQPVVMPNTQKYLTTMGEQIKMARLRRNLPVKLVCDRAGISRATLWQIEKGSPTVSIGAYACVLHALHGMDKDLLLIAKDDVFGKKLQNLGIKMNKRIRS